jgi:hypothetical protein
MPILTASPSGWCGHCEDRREVMVHLHYGLLAEILTELASSLAARDPIDELHRRELSDAAKQLAATLEPRDASA